MLNQETNVKIWNMWVKAEYLCSLNETELRLGYLVELGSECDPAISVSEAALGFCKLLMIMNPFYCGKMM